MKKGHRIAGQRLNQAHTPWYTASESDGIVTSSMQHALPQEPRSVCSQSETLDGSWGPQDELLAAERRATVANTTAAKAMEFSEHIVTRKWRRTSSNTGGETALCHCCNYSHAPPLRQSAKPPGTRYTRLSASCLCQMGSENIDMHRSRSVCNSRLVLACSARCGYLLFR